MTKTQELNQFWKELPSCTVDTGGLMSSIKDSIAQGQRGVAALIAYAQAKQEFPIPKFSNWPIEEPPKHLFVEPLETRV